MIELKIKLNILADEYGYYGDLDNIDLGKSNLLEVAETFGYQGGGAPSKEFVEAFVRICKDEFNLLIESSASGEEREQPWFEAQQARFALFNQILTSL